MCCASSCSLATVKLPYGLRVSSRLAALAAVYSVPAIGSAHFMLTAPPAITEQGPLGDPQKMPPCGDDGTATLTGMVTQVNAGDTITITIDEKVYHEGHYRIAIAASPEELPAEPEVTEGPDSPCGTVPIMDPPVYPVIADGVFAHNTPFDAPQSIDITIPADVTCTNCTLQIIQFMSHHGLNNPGGCFYHHCAALEVMGGAATGGETGASGADGTTSAGGDATSSADTAAGSEAGGPGGQTSAATTMPAGSEGSGGAGSEGSGTGGAPADDGGGCGCTSGEPGGVLGSLALLGLALVRRRRRAR